MFTKKAIYTVINSNYLNNTVDPFKSCFNCLMLFNFSHKCIPIGLIFQIYLACNNGRVEKTIGVN